MRIGYVVLGFLKANHCRCVLMSNQNILGVPERKIHQYVDSRKQNKAHAQVFQMT